MKTIFKRIIALVCCSVLFLLCFGCAGGAVDSKKIDLSADVIYPQSTDFAVHYCSTENLKEIDASGLITLLYDENSSSVGVRITNSEESTLWSALPQLSEDTVMSDEAQVVSLRVIHNDKIYYLNSQDNSVSLGGVFCEETDEGFNVTYLITNNGDWLSNIDLGATDEAYKSAAEGNVLYKVVVTYSLKDGCFFASLDWVNLGNEDDVLIDIGFLEYFGVSEDAVQGDYILIPDGSGALMDTASADEIAPVDIAVYGNDIAGSSQMSSVVPAYGMKCGNDAFAAVVEKGAAVARITANKAHSESNYNRVGSVFSVSLSESDEEYLYYSDVCYQDDISLCYRFLSGANAPYSGMAAACREQLIRNYTLSTRSVEVTEHMPMLVNVIGSVTPDGFLSFNKELTDFIQATDLLSRLKSKGINNVYLRYSGALTGGLNARNAAKASPLGSLGGESAVRELNNYAAGLNFSVFYDVNLLSDTKSSSSIRNLQGDKFAVDVSEPFSKAGFSVRGDKRYIVSTSTLETTVLSVLERFNSLDSTGYCLNDVGAHLYTDIASSVDREAVASAIAQQTAPLSTSSPVMIRGGNFYSLKNADVVTELPMECSRTQSDSYVSVPFVQIILHGIVEFSYDGINMLSDSKLALLKCVEYGAIPGYTLTGDALDDSEEYAKIFSADNWLNPMFETYSYISESLNDLRGSRITNHSMVNPGVYCTEYESTTRIYVNYTDEPVTISGITVEPMSFFRVN